MSSLTNDRGLSSAWRRLDKGQAIKWTVYSLLLINWGYYFFEELYISSYTLRQGGSLLDWTEAFATTIDEFAWFGLLFMFELETYALSDTALKRRMIRWSVHGFRLICYVLILHTIFAMSMTVVDFAEVTRATQVTHLCQLSEREISFGENYRYTEIDASNCAEISGDTHFYFLEPSVITDKNGYELERKLIWIDLFEACTWLLVIFSIELAVWLQNRDITGGALMAASHAAKLFYGLLFAAAAWWVWIGHWVWAWDEFLWISGFWAIERNLSQWREEILEEQTPG